MSYNTKFKFKFKYILKLIIFKNMKNSNFGQGKKVPPQFNDYMNIFRGLEDIIKAAFN